MTAAWFDSPQRLTDFMLDLVLAEVATLRPSLPPFSNSNSNSHLTFDAAGLGLDSIEVMALSTALSRALHLHESHISDNLFNQTTLAQWQATALRSLSVFSQRISFKTSGSVGLKKYHTHDLAHLEQEAAYLGQLLAGRQRILRAVPAHHIYGFMFSVLLPRYLGPSVEVIDIRGLSFNALQALLQAGDLVVAYPEFWQYWANAHIQCAPNVIGVNSSGPCPTEVGLQLLSLNLSTLFEVYGASETAGIGWRTHPLHAYDVFPFWQPSATAQQINRLLPAGKTQVYPLPDQLLWSSATRFMVKGRHDAMVQVGGINVSLVAVREKLLQHPLVKDAAVRLMLPEEGSRLKAYIVLNTDALAEADIENHSLDNHLAGNHTAGNLLAANHTAGKHALGLIQHYIEQNFSVAEQPKAISIGHSIPLNSMGKRCDWPI